MQYSLLMSLYIKEKPEFLDACFKSLSAQTIKPAETIMVFDGLISPELEAIVNKWKDELLIKIIRLEKNQGLGIALNHGLKNCNYNVVARADTDDIYMPNRMEEQLNHLKNNPDCVIVGSNIREFQEEINDINSIKKVPETSQEIIIYAKKRNPFNHMTVVYKKDFIESIGGYQHHLYMEDYNLWIRAISKNKNIYNIQKNLVYMRIGKNNDMIKRRRGINYLNSEYQLFKLIINKKINNQLMAFIVFMIRTSSRIMPIFLLSNIYKKLRK